MKHIPPIALLLALGTLIAVQIAALNASAPRPVSVPIVVPAAANRPSLEWDVACDANPDNDAELRERLRSWPVDRVLCAWQQTCAGRACQDRERVLAGEIVRKRHRILELRNRKHALNVEAMETAASILDDLSDEQRRFLFANRDQAVWEVREKPALAPLAGTAEP
jgi:hypothetical protein